MIVINKMVCSVQWCCNHCVKNTSITVNKYRFCISVIGHINKQIIGIVLKNQYRSITSRNYTLMCVHIDGNHADTAMFHTSHTHT